jgi:hypothetical protein
MRRPPVLAAALVAAALVMGCGRGGEPPAKPAPNTAPAEAATTPRNCARLELAPLTVARLDESQRRLFVVAPDGAEKPLDARIRDLESCFEFTEWAGRWSLSVFTDASLARYKDDPHVEAAVADGRWAKAYLAEYDAATRHLTRNPAGPK